MIRRPPRSTRKESSAASDVYKRQSQYIAPPATNIQPENMNDSGRVLPNVTNGEMIEYEINAYIQMNDYLCKIKRILIINPVRN